MTRNEFERGIDREIFGEIKILELAVIDATPLPQEWTTTQPEPERSVPV